MNENVMNIKELYHIVATDQHYCLCEIEDYQTLEEAIDRARHLVNIKNRRSVRIENEIQFHKDGHLYLDTKREWFIKPERKQQ